MDIDDRDYCRKDYLGLRDGADRWSPSLGRYCGNRKPRRRQSKTSSNALRIRLKSDSSVQGRGFSMWWTSYYKFKASKPARRDISGRLP
ncbi:bone morphogenetic protein 1 [Exaiptasia diaphana]|uniref:CUB domain-containing protein n=1 Tax=Exaiptasia diaphana TaxID=2652724 RepID=A0A913XSF3_EXADI|nr:bone morphogenetic protein 1 [Exaiptasia diaphana]